MARSAACPSPRPPAAASAAACASSSRGPPRPPATATARAARSGPGAGARRRRGSTARRSGCSQGEELVQAWRHPDGGFESASAASAARTCSAATPRTRSQMSIRMAAFDGDPGVRPSWRAFVAVRGAVGAGPRRRARALRRRAAPLARRLVRRPVAGWRSKQAGRRARAPSQFGRVQVRASPQGARWKSDETSLDAVGRPQRAAHSCRRSPARPARISSRHQSTVSARVCSRMISGSQPVAACSLS